MIVMSLSVLGVMYLAFALSFLWPRIAEQKKD